MSAGMTPMPRVRASKISLPRRRSSICWQKWRILSIERLVSSDPAGREVVLHAADAVEVGMEPTAGGRLDLVEDVLSIAEGVEDRGDRSELDTHVAQEEGDVGDAGHLEQEGADPLSSRRGLDAP